MTEDRKRLLISIATALVLHLAVLILTGLNSFDYQVPKKYGPLLVELSPPAREISEIPQITPAEKLVEDIATEAAAPAPAVSAEPPEVPEPQAEPAPSLPAASVKPAEPRPEPPSFTRAEPDEDFIAALINRTAGSEGVDARAIFGEENVPASTDNIEALAASGSASGSEVVLSDSPVSREEDYRSDVRNNSVAGDASVLAEDDLSSLDERLSTGSGSSVTSVPETAVTSVTSPVGTQASAGDSPMITFENASASRALSVWDHAEIPDEIREEGARKYTVVIDFLVDADGFTSGYRIRKPSGKAAIDAAVQSALRTWVFEAARAVSGSDQKKIPATLTYVIEIK